MKNKGFILGSIISWILGFIIGNRIQDIRIKNLKKQIDNEKINNTRA